jgi:predicted acyl esterase
MKPLAILMLLTTLVVFGQKAPKTVHRSEDRILVAPTRTVRIPSLNGKQIVVRVWTPKGTGRFPTLVGCPGGIGGATFNAEMPVREMLDAGIALVDFAPQGRAGSEGEEDEGGPTHQDDLKAVITYARTLPHVDPKQVAVLTRSFGVTMGIGCLARYPELKVLFLIDIEGPSAIRRPGKPEDYWKQRRASASVAGLTVPYLRIQCDVDHAQGENKRHMAELVNGALKGGKCPWGRVNDNPPNILYDAATPERYRWEKGVWTRNPQTNAAILRYIKEMFFEKPWTKPTGAAKH